METLAEARTTEDLQNYEAMVETLRVWGAVEVTPMEAYTDIFRLGEGLIQRSGEERNLKSNPLAYWMTDGEESGHYRVMLEDTFEETLKELQEADFAIMNGLGYFGRRNTQSAANRMFAMIIDLDDVNGTTLNNFLHAAIHGSKYDIYPVPNYIALSGHGVHLYYVLEDPVPLYPNIKLQLKELKYALTDKIWNHYTSMLDKKQFQGINQGFRVLGGRTKIEGLRVRVFRVNTHPVTLKQLGEFIPEEHRVDESKLYRESKMTLAEAQKKYPEWYRSVVEGGEKRSGHWVCKRDLYDWWKRKILTGASEHHRYFCIMCLAIYAMKSGISEEELEADAEDLIDFMNEIAPGNPFTQRDVKSALECYDERYFRFPIEDIVKLTLIPVEKNKRNGRKQLVHLGRIRALQQYDDPEGDWRNKDGRPSKEQEVRAWREAHPDGRKIDCIRETGISKKTVYKYWEKV